MNEPHLGGDEIVTDLHTIARTALTSARRARFSMRQRTTRTTHRQTRTDRTVDRAVHAAVSDRDHRLAGQKATLDHQQATITDLAARWAASQALAEEARTRIDELTADRAASDAARDAARADADIATAHAAAWEQRLTDTVGAPLDLSTVAAEPETSHELNDLHVGLGEAALLAADYAEQYGTLDAHTFAASSVGVAELIDAAHPDLGEIPMPGLSTADSGAGADLPAVLQATPDSGAQVQL